MGAHQPGHVRVAVLLRHHIGEEGGDRADRFRQRAREAAAESAPIIRILRENCWRAALKLADKAGWDVRAFMFGHEKLVYAGPLANEAAIWFWRGSLFQSPIVDA